MQIDVHKRVTKTLAGLLGVKEGHPDLAMPLLADMGIDSMFLVELAMDIEDEFGIEVPDEDAAQWRAIADVVSTVNAKVLA